MARFSEYEFDHVLGVFKEGAGMYMLCTETSGHGRALLSLWQQPWNPENGGTVFANLPRELDNAVTKDKHTKASATLATDVDVIFQRDVTDEEIARYTKQPRVEIRETATMYTQVTVPWVLETQGSRPNWIYNCLMGQNEADSVLYEDDNVMFLPDNKWDSKDTTQVYLLALFKDLSLKSVRDFGSQHIDILENVRLATAGVFDDKWGMQPCKFRAYFHYHPNYWHVHLHLVALGSSKLTSGILLDDVIEHLKMDGDYYRNATLTVNLAENSSLYERMAGF